MTEEKDPPIEEQSFLYGTNVVDIGDARVARGFSRRPHSSCKHHRLVYDTAERRIWCQDCERDVEGFDAFIILTDNFHRANEDIRRRRDELAAAESHSLISLAAKAVDEAWRSRSMVPTCPCCGNGIFPEDFKRGVGAKLGREYAAALRKQIGKPVP